MLFRSVAMSRDLQKTFCKELVTLLCGSIQLGRGEVIVDSKSKVISGLRMCGVARFSQNKNGPG